MPCFCSWSNCFNLHLQSAVKLHNPLLASSICACACLHLGPHNVSVLLRHDGTCFPQVETIKDQSDYLRHPLMEEIASEAATNINEAAAQLMKFHGSYQQDNRDKRTSGKGKFYQFMMRTRQPAGLVSNQLYLVMDTLADKVSVTKYLRSMSGLLCCLLTKSLHTHMHTHTPQPSACSFRGILNPMVGVMAMGYLLRC